jgi:hypothetical protein
VLAFDGRGRLWIGHQSRGVDIWEVPGDTASRLDNVAAAQGLPSSQITAIGAGGDGAWVGTTAGLGQVSPDLLVLRTLDGDVLPEAQVSDVAVDGCGRAWVATQAGVARLTGDGVVEAIFDDSSVPGPSDERVMSLSIDREQATVWFGSSHGFTRFEYDQTCTGGSTVPSGSCDRLCPYPNPLRVDRGQREVFLTDAPASVELTVLDALGRVVWSGRSGGGGAIWDGRDADGDPVPSGVYLLSIGSGGATELRQLAVIR